MGGATGGTAEDDAETGSAAARSRHGGADEGRPGFLKKRRGGRQGKYSLTEWCTDVALECDLTFEQVIKYSIPRLRMLWEGVSRRQARRGLEFMDGVRTAFHAEKKDYRKEVKRLMKAAKL